MKLSDIQKKELNKFIKTTHDKEEYRRASAVKQKMEGVSYRTIAKNVRSSIDLSASADGILQFRKEILPVAQMLISQEPKLEQRIENSKANSEVKRGFILKLKGFADKFQDRLESEAIDFIIKTAKDVGMKSIPILIDLMKQSS